MERLSTGLRINSAADDAAGLAIASKMSSQINGLTQAIRNAQDATSMLSTADGALVAVTDMIQRMRELSIQAISDTNTDSDRAALDLEYQALKDEIDRIARNTQWNGRTFFDGTGFPEGATFQIGSEANQTINVDIGTVATNQLGRVSNSDYLPHASTPPNVSITADTFSSHGSSAPSASSGTGFATHSSSAPSAAANNTNYISHASNAPTTTAGTGYATHASSVPTTTAISTTFDVTTTVGGPSPAAAPTGFIPQIAPPVIKTAAVPSGSVAAGVEFQVNTYTSSNQDKRAVTQLRDGGFVVAWESYGQDGSVNGIFGQRYASDGSSLGSEFQINTHTADSQTLPSVTSLNDGGFVVTWTSNGQDGDSLGIYGQRFASDGSARGSEFQINTHSSNAQNYSSVASLADGGFVVIWNSTDQDASGDRINGQRYASDGTTQGSEFQINTHASDAQFLYPSVTSLENGGFVATWASLDQDGGGYGVYGQRFSSAGLPQGTEFLINTHTPDHQWTPSVTPLNDGGFMVTWGSEAQDGSGFGIYGQRYASDGTALGSEFQINTYTSGEQSFPSIASLSDGGFVVTWNSLNQDSGGHYGIYGQRFAPDGTAQGSEFQINTYTSNSQEQPSVIALPDGGFLVAWSSAGQDGDGYGIFAQRFSSTYSSPAKASIDFSNRGLKEGDRITLSVTGGNQIQGVVGSDGLNALLTSMSSSLAAQDTIFSSVTSSGSAITMNGLNTGAPVADITVSLELVNSGALATHQSTAPTPSVTQSAISTASTGSEFQVNTTTASSQEYPQTASLADGGYVVVWNSNNQDGSQYGVFGQRFNSSGVAVGGEFQANTYTAYHQTDSKVTATGDGGFLVTWTSTAPQDGSGYGVFAQRFNSSGTKVGAEFQVNTTTSTHQLHSNPTALSGGGFVITWASNSQDGSGKGVYGQVYDASGASVGGEFKVNTQTNDDQYRPSVAGLDGGGFVVSWMSNNQDGDSWGVYAQRYDASGNTAGSEFKVNTHTASSQDYPAVTSLNDGGFVVTWHDDSGHDGSADGVFGQRYSSSGSATGSQFQINSTTAGTQAFSSISSLTDGGFVVTWTDYTGEDGSGKGIFGQRYDASGNKVASEFQINTHTSDDQSWSDVASLPNGGFIVTWGSNAQDGDSYGIYGQRFSSAITPATTTINFNNLSLTEGDRVTVNIPGGTQLMGIVGQEGVDALLSSFSTAMAAQNTLFGAVTSSSGVMTLTGLSTGAQLPSVTVGLEKNLQQKTIDFNSLSLSVGDKVTLTVPGGSQIVATYDSNGLSTLLGSIKTSYESNNPGAASVSSGILTLTGPGDGSAVPAVTVSVTSTNSVTKDGAYVPHPSSSPQLNQVKKGVPVSDLFAMKGGLITRFDNDGSGNFGDGQSILNNYSGNPQGGSYGLAMAGRPVSAAVSQFDFSNKALTEGDRVTLYIAGGTQVQGVVGSGGVDELLTSMSRSAVLQDTIFSSVSSSNGVLTLTGLSSGANLPNITVALEKNIKQQTIDFTGRSLVAGDRITLNIAGGTPVQGVLGSAGLQDLLNSLAGTIAAETSLFSAATSDTGVITLKGLTDGSALPTVTVSFEDNLPTSQLDFNSKNLTEGDRITLAIAGGTQVQGVVGSGGLNELLTSLANSAALQDTLFSAVTSSSGVMTFNGMTTDEALPAITVTLEKSIKKATLDFSGRNLIEGDRITLNITGGTQVQGVIGSGGLNGLLNTLASDVAAQSSLFSAASASSGVLTLTGLNDGSALADVTVSLEDDFLYSQLDFRNKNLAAGDRITVDVTGGTQVKGVIGSDGLDAALSAMATSIASQTSLYSAATATNGILTLSGADSLSAMPSLSVTLEAGIDKTSLDFSDKNLIEGDKIKIAVGGIAELEVTIGPAGIDAALTTLATEIANLSGFFSAASASSGILDIVGLTDGSPLASLNVTLETKPSMASVRDTAITSFQGATNTLERLDLAVSEINTKRASFGAALSRLDYAADNLSNIVMNARASRSRVLDADYARETTELARTQIIQQAAMAMLTQANMQASQVLELIEGSLID